MDYFYNGETYDELYQKLEKFGLVLDNSSIIGNLYIKDNNCSFLKKDSIFFGWKVCQYEEYNSHKMMFFEKDFVKWKHNYIQRTLIDNEEYYLYFDEDTSRMDMDTYYFVYRISEEDYKKIQTSVRSNSLIKGETFIGGIPTSSIRITYTKYGFKKLGEHILSKLFD